MNRLPCKAKGSVKVVNDGHCIIVDRSVQVCSTAERKWNGNGTDRGGIKRKAVEELLSNSSAVSVENIVYIFCFDVIGMHV